MQNSDNILAYMDDYGKVVVSVNRHFYQGKCDYFYISDNEGFCHDCVISRIEERADVNIYELSIPCDIKIGKQYYLVENHGVQNVIQYRFIVKTRQFNNEFYYGGNDLGAHYHKQYTDFALWAPTANKVCVEIENNHETYVYMMKRSEKGVYRLRVNKNLERATYVYYVYVNGKVNISADPYAISSCANGDRSAVINFGRLEALADDRCCAIISHNNEAIIYEASVRDLTSLASSGTSTHGLFLSLCEADTSYNGYSTGLSYIKELGITHIQLMPIFDFATVDENQRKRQYNWGYDPSQYNVPDGSFASDPNDPYARVAQLRKMINCFHNNGIRVNMDVVFNHMYDVNYSAFQKCVPYYYFRYNQAGYLSNGSYCGNDLDSTSLMVRKYILDSITFWMKNYGIDGFRFDLMGIMDITTMNEVLKTAKSINPNAMVYGEGWNMPTALADDQKASMMNNDKMMGIAHFNDYFRDVVKGKTSDDERYDQGYITGNIYKIREMESALIANAAMAQGYDYIYADPNHSISFVECHDNCTSWDKMKDCCKDAIREVRILKHKMMIAAVMFAQGVPFIHSGQEFCRTKLQYGNTYNKPDTINGIDWSRRCAFNDVVEYTKACIKIRKKYKAFKLNSSQEIISSVRFNIIDNAVLEYTIVCPDEDNKITEVKVVFNPTEYQKYLSYDNDYFIILDEVGMVESQLATRVIVVKPYSCVVFVR